MSPKTKRKSEFLINIAFIAVVALLVYLGFKYVLSLVLPFVLAFLIVTMVNPIIRRINQKFPKSKSALSLLLMVLLYISIGLLLFFAIVGIVLGLKGLILDFSENYYSDIVKPSMEGLWASISRFIEQLPPVVSNEIVNLQSSLSGQIQNIVVSISQKLVNWITGFTASIPRFVIGFVFTIMLSFFISVQYEQVVGFFKSQLPDTALSLIRDLRLILKRTVVQYLGALMTLMVITAVELTVGLMIIGVKHAILIGIGIAIFDALPVFGTGAIMIPWTLLELLQGNYRKAIGLLILYGVITLVRNIIEPKVVGDKLGLNPIVSMVSIYFGFRTFGVFGMIFMPMVVQILLELHRSGSIRIFRTKIPQIKEEMNGNEISLKVKTPSDK